MPIVYTPHDLSLSENSANGGFLLSVKTPEGPPKPVLFQFPPKVVGDSRGGNWKEDPAGPSAGDVIAVYQNAKPRIVVIEWVYIVDSASQIDGGKFSAARIHDELRKLRGYFRNPYLEGSTTDKGAAANSPMIVGLWMWQIGGNQPMSFRLESSNIKHSSTIVGKGRDAFPLRTDVSVELRSWPKIGTPPSGSVPGQLELTNDWF